MQETTDSNASPETKTKRKYKKRKTTFRNSLAISPHHDAIMEKYYELKRQHGNVNLVTFHNECVAPYVENFPYESFRRYIRRLEKIAAEKAQEVDSEEELPPEIAKDLPRDQQLVAVMPTKDDLEKLKENILNMSDATRESLAIALNIGLSTLTDIATGKVQMSAKDRVDLLFKAMKAQDSRVATAAKLRKDNREQAAFEREFGEAAYLG